MRAYTRLCEPHVGMCFGSQRVQGSLELELQVVVS